MTGLGEKIRTLRLKNNLTQTQLANKLDLTKSIISAYETEVRSPSYEALIKLSRLFNVTTDYLLGLEELNPATHNFLDVSELSEQNVELIKNLIIALKSK